MKKGRFLVSLNHGRFIGIIILIAALGSCEKQDPAVLGCTDPFAANYISGATEDDGSCVYTGRVTFWHDSYMSESTTVIVNGQTEYITEPLIFSNLWSFACNWSGGAVFDMNPGIYSYSASNSTSSWSGQITVETGDCEAIRLDQ